MKGLSLASSFYASEAVAIVGMACRLPGNIDRPDLFWEQLLQAGSPVTEVPSERWRIDDYFDPDKDCAGKIYCRFGAWLKNIEQFDAAFFGISPREARVMDPQQRLLLEVSWEALENAGIAPLQPNGSRTGVFVGISTTDYSQRYLKRNDPTIVDGYCGTGNAFSVAAGRLSYTFDFSGPSFAVDTACSSSLVAVHAACLSLRQRECDAALVGGVNAIVSPDTTISFSRAHMLAADGRCKTFDESADGYVRGEGCGVVILKRLSDALRDRDNILAVIRGSAVNHDGRSNGLTAPSGAAQEQVILAALADAGLRPEDVDYIEAHGTGTPLGDPIELGALGRVFGPGRQRPLIVGSVKTNIGHLEAAAGIAGLAKLVLSLGAGEIPAHLHFQRPNPHVRWEELPLEIPRQRRNWERGAGPRRGGVSSFGFGGTNAHVVVEEAPPAEREARQWERPLHLLCLSARSEGALDTLARSYAEHLERHAEEELGDVVYTAHAGRSHLGQRMAVIGKDREEMAGRLRAAGEGESGNWVQRGRAGQRNEVVFLFPGQGSQYSGMCRELYESQPVVREVLERAAGQLEGRLEGSLWELLWGEEGEVGERLVQTGNLQPVMFAVEWALVEMWGSWGIEPGAVLGHSLGEYGAACAAGVLKWEEGLELVWERARLMQEQPGGGAMAAVYGERERVEEWAWRYGGGQVGVAADNGPGETVLSGERGALERVLEECRGAGMKGQHLKVSHAFHSARMEPVLERFGEKVRGVKHGAARIGLLSNWSGDWVEGEGVDWEEHWKRQMRQPVEFRRGMERLVGEGYRTFVEVGPQTALLGLGRRCAGDVDDCVWLPSLRRGRGEWQQVLETLGRLYTQGAEVDWKVFDRGYGRRRVILPTYPFERQRHWVEEEVPKQRSASASPWLHPMLGWRVSSPLKPVQFESEISLDRQPYLKDHKVWGTIVLPASGYIEMALAAAREIWGDEQPVVLESLRIEESLPLKPGDNIRIQNAVTVDSPGEAGWSLYTHTPGEGEIWRRNASAVLRLAGSPSEPTGPSGSQLDAASYDTSYYYDELRARGLQYGPSFQCITHIQKSDGHVTGRVKLPDSIKPDGYHFHPCLLDSCFQVLGALLDPQHDRIYLPVGMERFIRRSNTDGELTMQARVRSGERSESLAGDLEVYDPAGNCVVEIVGLQLQATRKQAWVGHAKAQADPWIHEVAWRQKELSPGAARPAGGRWLILEDDTSVAGAVAAGLESRGRRSTIADPRNAVQLLSNEGPWEGVVHLGGLKRITDVGSLAGAYRALLESAFEVTRAAVAIPKKKPPLWFVTAQTQPITGGEDLSGLAGAPVWGFARSAALEYPDLRIGLIDVDHTSLEPGTMSSLCDELAGFDSDTQVALAKGKRYVARLAPGGLQDERRRREPYRLEITSKGVLDNLALRRMERSAPGPGEVEIQVRATGLNFRDVLNVLGLYPGDAGPLGGECAGTITAVGEGVVEFAPGQEVVAIAPGSFSSFVTGHSAMVWPMPKGLTHAEGATIAIPFLTAYYGLHSLASMQPGDTVLIHAAAGGVGIAAVQLALDCGAEVFATASPSKWETLRAMGVQHVMNSRTLEFADRIRALTGGRGVDIALNSLSGPYIEHTLSVLANGGRYLEIGKRDTWTPERAAEFRPDTRYFIYDLAELLAKQPIELGAALRKVMEGIEEGRLKPLPRVEFPIQSASEAFRHMAQAKHIGKVVVTHPEPIDDSRPLIRGDRTYLITGGAGALGLQLAQWLVDEGARSLALVSRGSGVPADLLERLHRRCPQVALLHADIGNCSEAAGLIEQVRASMPPLAGIFHLAGVLHDGLLLQQDWSAFDRVLDPKAHGAWNLHTLTLDCDLDFFVLFSSAASVIGSPGQTNYAAANAFLDSLAHYRRRSGRHGLSVNWGAWQGAGMAATMDSRREGQGLAKIPPDLGFELLADLLRAGRTQTTVFPVDWPKFIGQFTATSLPPLLAEFAAERPSQAGAAVEQHRFLNQLRRSNPRKRRSLLMSYVEDQVRKVLGLDSRHAVDPRQGLNSLGMDSLMAVELRSRLQAGLGVDLPATMAFEHPNIEAVADFLLSDVLQFETAPPSSEAAMQAEAAPGPQPGPAPVVAPVPDAASLDALSESEIEALLSERLNTLGGSA